MKKIKQYISDIKEFDLVDWLIVGVVIVFTIGGISAGSMMSRQNMADKGYRISDTAIVK